MDQDTVSELVMHAIRVTLMVSAPMLLGALIIGIAVSIFQAVTQINEQTLAFIPKILVIFGAMVIFAPWMSELMITYTTDLYVSIPKLIVGK